jgi:hypothetical protein
MVAQSKLRKEHCVSYTSSQRHTQRITSHRSANHQQLHVTPQLLTCPVFSPTES